MRTLFPYIGGKHRIAKRLAQVLPEHKCYVEVFAGAANLLLAKEPSKSEVINDVNSDLVNIFRVIRYHADELLKELAFLTHSREEFNASFDQPGLTDIQRAARYWYRLRTTFGGTGSKGNRSFSTKTLGKATIRLADLDVLQWVHHRLDGVQIENDDFERIIDRYDRKHTVFFCDPPYYEAADYGVKFDFDDHERLATALRAIKGKFLMTIGNHKRIRPLYKGFNIKTFNIRYTVARDSSAKSRNANELLIANYRLQAGKIFN